jgi:flagellin
LTERFPAWKSCSKRVGLFTLGVFIMSMTIGTNISSLNAQRHLATSKADMENAMERLASGNRINSSRDDAAGLSISGRMSAQVSGLNQAVRNANDGIALAQSAEGALDETTSILQRMRDLSVQASSSTLTKSDRTSIQAEVTALTSELDRIASATSFNNISLLDGTAKDLKIQVGSETGQSISLTIAGASSSDLGINGGTASSSGGLAGGRMATLAGLNGDDVFINGVAWVSTSGVVGANEVINDANGDALIALTSTADGVAAIINAGTSSHGAVATASNLVVGTVASGDTDGAITINAVAISAAANLTEFVANINDAAPNVTARLNSAGNAVELFNTNGDNISIVGNTAALAGTGLSAGTSIGFLSLSNTDGTKTILNTGTNVLAATSDIQQMGFNARTDASTIVSTGVSVSTNITATEDFTINGVTIGPNATDTPSASALATHLNTYSASTNVTASAKSQVTLQMLTATAAGATKITASTANMIVNGTAIALTQNATVTATIATINTTLSGVGVSIVATQGDGVSDIVLTSSSGETIEVKDIGTHVSKATNIDGVETQTAALANIRVEFGGQLTLTNTSGGDITFGTVNGTEGELDTSLALLGLHAQGTPGASSTSSTGLSMASTTTAAAAITAIDAALEKVFANRGDLGAFQNRLDHTVSNLRNVSENTSFSMSQIMDADFAEESANLAKAQVLQQAGTAMLAQANASGQGVLSLLKG